MLQHNLKRRKSNATSVTSQFGLESTSWWEVPDLFICRCSQCRTIHFQDRIYGLPPPIAKAIHDVTKWIELWISSGCPWKEQAFFLVSQTQDMGHSLVFTDVSDWTPRPARPNGAKASSVLNPDAPFLGNRPISWVFQRNPKALSMKSYGHVFFLRAIELSLASIKIPPYNYLLHKLIRATFSTPNTFHYLFLLRVRLLL